MNCRFHVGIAMMPIVQRIPFTSINGPCDAKRTVYRCPIAGCNCVGYEFEAERVDSRYCNVCGAKIGNRDVLSDRRCLKCVGSQRRSRDIPLDVLLKRDGAKLPRSMWKRRRRINREFVGAVRHV